MQLAPRPACSARAWLQDPRPTLPLLPTAAFDCGGSMLREAARQTILKEPAARSGLSLARSGCLVGGHLSGVFVPGLPLRCLADPCCESVRSPTPLLFAALRRRGGSSRAARYPRSESAIPAPPRALLPVRIFRSLRLVAWPDLAPGSSLVRNPVPASLPAAGCFEATGGGSSLSGFGAAPSSLFREPLGTILIMRSGAAGSQPKKVCFGRVFHRLYLL